jgi:sugar fermentation stimulation protein A
VNLKVLIILVKANIFINLLLIQKLSKGSKDNMIISNLIKGVFVERPNRFTVIFQHQKLEKDKIKSSSNLIQEDAAHLKDPGRLKELLYPGVELLLRKVPDNPNRKTKFDVIAVFKDNMWVIINSGLHSDLAADLIESGLVDEFKDYYIEKREYTFGKSRLDFLLSPANEEKAHHKQMLVEVKGCTLVESNLARFPDAPTTRGKKHLEELMKGKKHGFDAAVLFLIMKEDAEVFSPNYVTDPDFSEALERAEKEKAHIIPYVFKTTLKNSSLIINPLRKINTNFIN